MKILFVKTHSIGDVLLSSGSMRSVMDFFPEADFYCLTSKKCSPVLAGLDDNLKILPLRKNRIGYFNLVLSYLSLLKEYGLNYFDEAYVYNPNVFIVLFTWLLSRKTFSLQKKNLILNHLLKTLGIRTADWIKRGKYILDTYNSVSELNSIRSKYKIPYINRERYQEFHNRRLNCIKGRSYLAFFPGGGVNIREKNTYKRLGSEQAVNLARELYKKGIDNLIMGGDGSDDIFSETEKNVLTSDCKCILIMGLTDIHDLIMFIKSSSAVITTDSLPLHIAVSLGKPTVALFGPSDEKSLLPANSRSVFVLRGSAECSPCYANETFPGCKNEGICMKMIDLNKVVELVQKIYPNN